MSKTKTPRSIQLASVASWYKLYGKDVLRGFIEASEGRAKDARIYGMPTPEGNFFIRIIWGENISLAATLSHHGFWNLHLVPELPSDCKNYTLCNLVTQDEHILFNDRSWFYSLAAITYLNAKPESVGRRIWFGIGSDLTDVWPVVGRFIERLHKKERSRAEAIEFMKQRGWQHKGNFLVMPGLAAPRIRLASDGGGYVVEQERPIPLGELGAFLERFRQT